MSKMKDAAIGLANAIGFSMKAAGDEIMGPADNHNEGTVIQQNVTDHRVAKHLLNAEITEEVKELRYRTYKVEKASKDWTYLTDGVAVKKKPKAKTKRFSMENKVDPQSVLEELQRIGKYGEEKYVINVKYNCFPRFKVEQFAKSISVDLEPDENGFVTTELWFLPERDGYNPKSGPFISELEGTFARKDISRREIGDSLESIYFTTYKAVDEDDMVKYEFNGLQSASLEKRKVDDNPKRAHIEFDYYVITYKWKTYSREDLQEKFFHKELEEKYEKKESKHADLTLMPEKRVYHCARCGKEMSVYDADILHYDGEDVYCTDCIVEIQKEKGIFRDETANNNAPVMDDLTVDSYPV